MIASVTKNLVLIGLIGLTLALVARAQDDDYDEDCEEVREECTLCFPTAMQGHAMLQQKFNVLHAQCCQECRK